MGELIYSVKDIFEKYLKSNEKEAYNIPEYEKHCTYRLFRDNLASLCKMLNIPLNHHDALSDAKACGELFLINIKEENTHR